MLFSRREQATILSEEQGSQGVDSVGSQHGASVRTRAAIREILAGRRHGLRAVLPLLGPAMVTSVAYVDPGNFATNISAGAQYGYALLWVVIASSVVAMLFQSLAARIGIVTGRNLPELCRDHFPRPVVLCMWAVSEVAAMATDLAEFLGGAVGLSLLLHIPVLAGMAGVGVITTALLMLDRGGFRPLELVIGALVAIIGLCYLAELTIVPPAWLPAMHGALLPRLPDRGAVTLAVGIVGATIMPHAIYLHSGLTQARIGARNDVERRLLVRYSNREVVGALSLAGLVNAAMLMMAAAAFHAGHRDVAAIETAYHTLAPLLGGAAAFIFLASLMASGISSSVVGTMAGQMIMQGFLRRAVPVWLRRAVTMLPALAVVAAGVDVTRCLVISQVVLSLVLPVPMVSLLVLSGNTHVMGDNRPGQIWLVVSWAAAAVTLGLDALLIAGGGS